MKKFKIELSKKTYTEEQAQKQLSRVLNSLLKKANGKSIIPIAILGVHLDGNRKMRVSAVHFKLPDEQMDHALLSLLHTSCDCYVSAWNAINMRKIVYPIEKRRNERS